MKQVKQVKVYSTGWCPYCKMEEAWLKNIKVDHEVVMVDQDATAAAYIVDKTGQRGVPVTEIIYEDEPADYVIGFDRPTLQALLGVQD